MHMYMYMYMSRVLDLISLDTIYRKCSLHEGAFRLVASQLRTIHGTVVEKQHIVTVCDGLVGHHAVESVGQRIGLEL